MKRRRRYNHRLITCRRRHNQRIYQRRAELMRNIFPLISRIPRRRDAGACKWKCGIFIFFKQHVRILALLMCSEIEQFEQDFKWQERELVARAKSFKWRCSLVWDGSLVRRPIGLKIGTPNNGIWILLIQQLRNCFHQKKSKKTVNLTSDSYALYCKYAWEKLLFIKGTKINFLIRS